MAGDLEDFLRRAAERRKAKAGQAPPPPPKPAQPAQPPRQRQRPPQRPQRDDMERRAETISRPAHEEVVIAEVVEEAPDSLAVRQRKIAEAKRQAAKAQAAVEKAKRARSSTKTTGASQAPAATGPVLSNDLAADLLRMLRDPAGIQRAILLREILERPEHRW